MKICKIDGCNNKARSKGKGRVGAVCDRHHRERYPHSPERCRRKRLSKYGLTIEGFNGLLAGQGGCCSICGNVLDSPQVDHCHTTGVVRGLLCNKCNLGLGMFDDDIDLLASATSYLINGTVRKTG